MGAAFGFALGESGGAVGEADDDGEGVAEDGLHGLRCHELAHPPRSARDADEHVAACTGAAPEAADHRPDGCPAVGTMETTGASCNSPTLSS
ncbi:hypothetical protein AQI88_17730 [Streptomyces cellostaticus]|uniref:Uncharacterized protein n=1 Tax=Streptomyces cellostaticus TaxID=67285 RepID=A0A101NKY8_9ACTN|nr:hypothetical protein AQI88_17730 [Streptomyces cellostaticus]GHI02017.1 hypothetical protein Scel_03380 [Streptomyces cellostaticus]